MYTSILSITLLSIAANAAPTLPIITNTSPVYKDVWNAPKDGNTKVRFGDGKVYVGSCTPQSVIDTLYDNCYDEGFCNPSPWTLQCLGSDGGSHTVTITSPEGQFQPWIKNGLVAALNAAIAVPKVVDSNTDNTAMSGGGCVGCTWTAKSFTSYTIPDTIGISHLNAAGVPPDVITLSIANDYGANAKGLCGILTGIGGGISSAVSGVAGGIFQLASVACNAIN